MLATLDQIFEVEARIKIMNNYLKNIRKRMDIIRRKIFEVEESRRNTLIKELMSLEDLYNRVAVIISRYKGVIESNRSNNPPLDRGGSITSLTHACQAICRNYSI